MKAFKKTKCTCGAILEYEKYDIKTEVYYHKCFGYKAEFPQDYVKCPFCKSRVMVFPYPIEVPEIDENLCLTF